MKRYVKLIFLWVISFTSHAQELGAETSPKTYAVIIGISNFESLDIPTLQYAHKDAALFYSHLRSPAGGNVPESQLKLLQNNEASISAIYEALDWLKEQCSENDIAYIYFSGHGDLETKEQKTLGYLLAYNSPPNNYSNNAISLEDLNDDANYLTLTKKAKVVLITDACHSGKLAGDFFKGKHFVNEQLQLVLNNEARLTSCAVDELSAEGVQWGKGRGVFSYYLINGLSGFADLQNDGDIQLKELQDFLKSSFVKDASLLTLNHKQNPVLDGSPLFLMANDKKRVFKKNRESLNAASNTSGFPAGFAQFSKAKPQAIDYFFDIIDTLEIEKMIDFNSFSDIGETDFPLAFISNFKPSVVIENRSFNIEEPSEADLENPETRKEFIDKIHTVLDSQLRQSQSLQKQFTKKFILHSHNAGQKMINAYLSGDVKELEKRHYYSDSKGYSEFLEMLKLTRRLIPITHHLANVLEVNYHYLNGLIARINMAISTKSDSLLEVAFSAQLKTMNLEPYAAYTHNEIGNLYTWRDMLDSAKYHYDMASVLAPTWVIPWSNKIRLNLMWDKLDLALEAINVADSLQPGLDLVQINAGKVMERINYLTAESFYLKAIKINNKHYLPFERLGYIYSASGRYELADAFLSKAESMKSNFHINELTFTGGIAANREERLVINDKIIDSCNYISTNNYSLQHQTFLQTILSKNTSSEKITAFKDLLTIIPNLPLVHHYLGVELVKNNEWEAARVNMLNALEQYHGDESFENYLWASLGPQATTPKDSCLVRVYLSQKYEVLEDHNFLALIYTNLDSVDKAIFHYQKIISLEEIKSASDEDYSATGLIRLARYYVKLKQYKKAEELLIKGFNGRNPFYLKFELENFYSKMVEIFPRDFYWKEQNGLFLYQALVSRGGYYDDINYLNLSDNFLNLIYHENLEEIFDAVEMDARFDVLGTNEIIWISNPDTDYSNDALNNLKGAIALSGEVEPPIKLLAPIADIYMRNKDYVLAANYYREILKKDESAIYRNALIKALLSNFDYVDATEELSFLNKRNEISESQKALLAQNLIFLKEFDTAKTILDELETEDFDVKAFIAQTNIILNLQKGNWSETQKAINDYKAIISSNQADSDRYNEGYGLYSSAVVYAMTNNDELAMSHLKQALIQGFIIPKLIDCEPLWDRFKLLDEWSSIEELIKIQ
jgi:tetratricopeptide (TPR) repeat protein